MTNTKRVRPYEQLQRETYEERNCHCDGSGHEQAVTYVRLPRLGRMNHERHIPPECACCQVDEKNAAPIEMCIDNGMLCQRWAVVENYSQACFSSEGMEYHLAVLRCNTPTNPWLARELAHGSAS